MSDFVLAFDIEYSGFEVLAIGAALVITENYREYNLVDSYFYGIYTDDTKFADKCYNEFWKKNLNILEILKYKGTSTAKEDREKELIEGFQNFRKKCESYADLQGKKLILTSDNNVFDGGLVNELIKKYLKCEGIPYTAGKQQYSSFFETFSQQKGLLTILDGEFTKKSDWGYSDKIFELYDIDKYKIEYIHDHNPVNDAYTIAVDQLILLGIRDKHILLKN